MIKTKIIAPFLLTFILLLCPVITLNSKDDTIHLLEAKDTPQTILPHTEQQAIETLIRIMAGETAEDAVRVARCESMLGKYKTNWEGSSAYGLFQFMPKTFNAYCKGDIKNNYDQIRCFLELYPKHPNWWLCR